LTEENGIDGEPVSPFLLENVELSIEKGIQGFIFCRGKVH
jgi:hypothetical protein